MNISEMSVRLLSISFRRYCSEPTNRRAASLHMLRCAVRLYAQETCAAEASAVASEAVSEVLHEERRVALMERRA